MTDMKPKNPAAADAPRAASAPAQPAAASAPAAAHLAGSPRTPDMPDDIRQHICTGAEPSAPAVDVSRASRLAMKERAMSGRPFGAGSGTEHEGATMTGAQAVIASLEAEGVDVLFGYPGGQAIKIYDALYDSTKIRHILARHEQAAVHEADGYARATGKVGVVLVTSGPGATNTVTGIATAYMDSVPLVVITGQVTRGVIGTDAFQEADIVGITMPVVKHSFLLQSTDDLTRTFREAFYIASTGRPGPVLIDIPSDLAGAEMVFHYADSVNIPSYRPTYRGNAKQVKQAVELIRQACRPLIMAGGGVVSSHACDEVVELAEKMQIPVVTTLLGKAAVPCSNPLNLGPVGMHGSKYANMAVTECDLLIAVGARFSDRVTGKLSEFAPHATVIHVDIDPAEIGKVRNPRVPIVGDAQVIVAAINERLDRAGAEPQDADWVRAVFEWRERWPFYTEDFADYPDRIAPEQVLEQLSNKLDPHASVITTEVGQHQMWAHQHIHREESRTFLSSGGLGTMGFGFPAAIGAKIGRPDCQVVCIAGDGSLQMNIQEMATAIGNGVAVKVLVIDNNALGMVHQWQRLFYHERYSCTEFTANPDFVKLAEAYGWQAERITHPDQVGGALDRMLAADAPYLLDVVIPTAQTVYPMVAPGAAIDDIIGAIDLTLGGVRVTEKGMSPAGEMAGTVAEPLPLDERDPSLRVGTPLAGDALASDAFVSPADDVKGGE
ncbi:biosynthetic-type acetolactate synthase large subunit [uncultured Enorma sp.]|uniref:biosynthetic-type acetolactate synthase large subunit n=1 Tax=uncultured Enorma sp. TaxID=1714346 RepID=UPI002597C423|nr:biosynthetic-type acetolactate synthase large subunit [uncultured Enorma sp.]